MTFAGKLEHGIKKVGHVALIVGEVAAPIAVPILTHGIISRDQIQAILSHNKSVSEVSQVGNWLARMLTLIPIIVSGIEHIHGDGKSGADKKALAMEALGLSAGVAGAVAPGQQEAIDAAKVLASNAIDGVKAVYNAVKKQPAPVPAVSAPTPAPGSGIADFLQPVK